MAHLESKISTQCIQKIYLPRSCRWGGGGHGAEAEAEVEAEAGAGARIREFVITY